MKCTLLLTCLVGYTISSPIGRAASLFETATEADRQNHPATPPSHGDEKNASPAVNVAREYDEAKTAPPSDIDPLETLDFLWQWHYCPVFYLNCHRCPEDRRCRGEDEPLQPPPVAPQPKFGTGWGFKRPWWPPIKSPWLLGEPSALDGPQLAGSQGWQVFQNAEQSDSGGDGGGQDSGAESDDEDGEERKGADVVIPSTTEHHGAVQVPGAPFGGIAGDYVAGIAEGGENI